MPEYPHFVPFLSPAPPPGYRSTQVLPLKAVRSVLDRQNATLDILREVIFEGKIIRSDLSSLVLREGHWADEEAGGYELDPVDGCDWAENGPMAFVQTTVTARDAKFSQLREPGFYAVYSGPERKTFLSDSSQKFAHPVVIGQVAAFGKWAEGYPSCVVEPEYDAAESVLLLNPYEKPAVATLEIEGLEQRHKYRIQPFSGRRVDVAPLLDPTMLPWQGQIYLTGPPRCYIFRKACTE